MTYIKISREGRAGYITLDRPKALNSLTHGMIQDIHAGLREHEANNDVDVIVMRSASDRAFCAGGDMKATREMALDKKWDELAHFFEKEYALNLNIAQCSKPYVSLVNGIAMGGGLGLSVHGSVMVVSETARLAMPETAIGFFPDVGGTYFLSRLCKNAGSWLAISGQSVIGREAVLVGLATHCIAETEWSKLTSSIELNGQDGLDALLTSLADTSPEPEFETVLDKRQSWFEAKNHSQLVENLTGASAGDDRFAKDAAMLLKRIESMSPFAMDLTRRLLADAKNSDLPACLKMELKAGTEAVQHADFVEGVRAVLVDKDKAVWVSSPL